MQQQRAQKDVETPLGTIWSGDQVKVERKGLRYEVTVAPEYGGEEWTFQAVESFVESLGFHPEPLTPG